MQENVLVMLSSYNGEKYIEEQIDTILAQEGVTVKLFVRDDGSTDSTPEILDNYKKKGKLEYYIGDNQGWKRSFMELVKDAPVSDYYAFADQDDLWLPEKLKMAIGCLKSMPTGPQLYSSNGSLWKDGNIIGKVNPKKRAFNKYTFFINPSCQGCTLVFNRSMLQIVKEKIPQIEVPHDSWITRLAILLNAYYYDDNSYILYRQHSNNELGADTSLKETLKRRRTLYVLSKRTHYLDLIANEMLNSYGEMFGEESYQLCYTIANYRITPKCYIKLLLSPRYKCNNLIATLGFKYRVLMKMI